MARLCITLAYPEEGDPVCIYAGSDSSKATEAASNPGNERFKRFEFIRNPTAIRKANPNYRPTPDAPAVPQSEAAAEDQPRRGPGRPPKQT